MKLTGVIVFALTAYIANAIPLTERETPEYNRFIMFGDNKDNIREIDLEAEPNMELVNEFNARDVLDNVYLLYTRENPSSPQTLEMDDADSIISSNFNPDLPTVFIVHGWLSNRYTSPNPDIRDAYLEISDVNIIVMEWRRVAALDYATATVLVPSVGRGLGEFINFLNSITGAPFSTMHVIGFSLGGHVIAGAGRATNGQIQRITGLDPAGPLWSYNLYRLSSSDAVYVEVIHTDGGSTANSLGIGSALGDADFFPNGGSSQPGCLTNFCDHQRAYQFFAATVKYDHLLGRQCSNALQIILNTCRGDTYNMGNSNLNKSGSGLYRLDTGSDYPY